VSAEVLNVRLTEGEREVMRVKARESGMDSVILYIERILSRQRTERDVFWRDHLTACDPWREPCGWCGKAPADPIATSDVAVTA
jgi:hypothetical protein